MSTRLRMNHAIPCYPEGWRNPILENHPLDAGMICVAEISPGCTRCLFNPVTSCAIVLQLPTRKTACSMTTDQKGCREWNHAVFSQRKGQDFKQIEYRPSPSYEKCSSTTTHYAITTGPRFQRRMRRWVWSPGMLTCA